MGNHQNYNPPALKERSWLAISPKNVYFLVSLRLLPLNFPPSFNQRLSESEPLFCSALSCLSFFPTSLHPSSSRIDRLLPVFSGLTAQFRDHGVHVTSHLLVWLCKRACVCVFIRNVKGLRGHRDLWGQRWQQSCLCPEAWVTADCLDQSLKGGRNIAFTWRYILSFLLVKLSYSSS